MFAASPSVSCRCGAERFERDRKSLRKSLQRFVANLLGGWRTPSLEEQYLAQATDAQDFQVRLLALERARP